MIELSGSVALVTGGSRGIGAAVCRYLGRAGADVAVNYFEQQEAAETVVNDLRKMGRRADTFQADVADSKAIKALFDQVKERLGPIHILVNNAGIWWHNPIQEFSERDLDRTLAVNLSSVFYCCHRAIEHFKLHDEGCIVNLSSTAGQRGESYYSPYAATKSGIIGLTKSLAVELAPLNVRVNAVAPGWVDTEMSASALQDERELASILEKIPLRRVAIAEDIAGSVVFLASDLARHITGEVLNVNGGSVLCG
ncbi:MAG: SDR family NAD(P)-dependent oxidoreductase [Candidatus Bipolaricaulia bacterium]